MIVTMVKELDHHKMLGGLVAIGLGGPGLESDWLPKSRALQSLIWGPR
jgi:hypothetical protein